MLQLDGESLTIEDVFRTAHQRIEVAIAPHAVGKMRQSRAVVERLAESGRPICP